MTMDIVQAQIASIQVDYAARIRPADDAAIARLAESIRKLGLINPITVTPDRALIAGLHRLEACKRLGWETIPAIVKDYSQEDLFGPVDPDAVIAPPTEEQIARLRAHAALMQELAEIDENLIRNDLSELMQGLHHVRRKRVYERLFPEVKNGGDRGNQHTGGKSRQKENFSVCQSYAADAAQAIGVTERTVRNKTRIGEALEPIAEKLVGTAIEDNQSELLALVKLQKSKPDVAEIVVQRLAEEPAVTARLMTGATETAKPKRDPKPASIKQVVKAIKSERKAAERDARHVIAREVSALEPGAVEDANPIQHGDWWRLGRHTLYCGDTSKPEFYERLPEVEFAFADPPYGVKADEWDGVFYWEHDWLIDKAPIVAVTPGQPAIVEFARKTTMPYRNSMASWITNGMTLSEFGYQNWIYLAFFARHGIKIFRQCQDVIRCTIDTSTTDETSHRGRKPVEMMAQVLDLYCTKQKTVIDPFLGSGTTLLVAEKTGRTCYGGELSPEYCWAIMRRWEAMTGERGVKL